MGNTYFSQVTIVIDAKSPDYLEKFIKEESTTKIMTRPSEGDYQIWSCMLCMQI